MLTAEQIEQYKRTGFVNAGPLLDEATVAALQAEVLRVIDDRENASVPQPVLLRSLGPDDCALHIPFLNALAIADTVVKFGESDDLQLVPDNLMGDAEAETRAILDGLAALAERLEFDHLLLAHGTPVIGDGRDRLRAFAAS